MGTCGTGVPPVRDMGGDAHATETETTGGDARATGFGVK